MPNDGSIIRCMPPLRSHVSISSERARARGPVQTLRPSRRLGPITTGDGRAIYQHTLTHTHTRKCPILGADQFVKRIMRYLVACNPFARECLILISRDTLRLDLHGLSKREFAWSDRNRPKMRRRRRRRRRRPPNERECS